MKIGLVYDLRDDYLAEGFTAEQVAEFDSPITLAALQTTLTDLGHTVERIGHGRALCARLVSGDRWDLVLSIAEGIAGRSREAQVPAILELYGQPYAFSDPLTCAVTLDKAVAKRIVRDAGLHTPEFVTIATVADLDNVRLPFPVFAKPIAEGTGKGVDGMSRVDNAQDLRETCTRLLTRFNQPVLVEAYLPGREFTTAILGTGQAARVIGTMEVRIHKNAPAQDYSYEVKELCEDYVDYGPLEPGALRTAVEALALGCYRALDVRDTGRVDIRLDRHGVPAFIEINPLPGLHPLHSDLPMIATQEGLSYRDLLDTIVTSAASRYGIAIREKIPA
jgi:D-alanine-D-alanine ligase